MLKRILWVLAALLLIVPPALAEEGKPLYAVKDENGLWGYIDCKGNMVIPGTFTEAEDFRGNYALVRQDWGGLYGIIDAQGEWVLPPEHEDILSISDSGNWANGRDNGVYLVVQGWKKGTRRAFSISLPASFPD